MFSNILIEPFNLYENKNKYIFMVNGAWGEKIITKLISKLTQTQTTGCMGNLKIALKLIHKDALNWI